jgi:hypothetical protein
MPQGSGVPILPPNGYTIYTMMMYTGRQEGTVKRTNIYLDEEDREALQVIRAAHGIGTDASAVRFAIRQVARELERKTKRDQRAPSEKAARTDD